MNKNPMNTQPIASPRGNGPGTCPQCGTPIPEGAPQGLCPACVLAGAMGGPATVPAGATRATEFLPSLERVAAAFPQLEVVDWIGAGGMGVVLKARQRHLDRWVALKLLPESLSRDPQFVERFHREARVLARLNHPNIVTVFDFGEAGGFPFLLMEYVDGVNLREAMQAGRFSPAEALDLVPRICEALQFAHEEGILHRDIKPENILLDARGRVKIADFGIAKMVGASRPGITLTASGAAIGTPQYMAPEQLERPGDVDHRADIYSLGVVLYEMLTGELPLGRFAAPSEKVPMDRRVDDIVLRALAKERELRQQSATQVKTEVEGIRTPPASDPAAGPGFQASSGVGATQPPVAATAVSGDFLLCNPALPRMAQVLTVYALLVGPLGSLLFLVAGTEGPFESPYARFIDAFVGLGQWTLTMVLSVVLMAGGWWLRTLHPRGPRWIRMGLGLNLVTGVAMAAVVICRDHLESEWLQRAGRVVAEDPALSAGDALLGVLALAALVFEILALVWLVRNRHRLDLVIAAARPGCGRAAAEAVASAPVSGTARGATLSAVLTGLSLAVGMPLFGAAAWHTASLWAGRPAGGLGGVEIALLVGLLAGVVGLGIAGAWVGGRSLASLRTAAVPLGGIRRVVLGVFGWLLVLLGGWVATSVGAVAYRLEVVPFAAAAIGGVAGVLVVEVVLRVLWRRCIAVTAAQRMGYAPAWIHAVAFLAVLAVIASLAPACTVALQHLIRISLPKLEVIVRPDSHAGTATRVKPSEMRMDLEVPGRSLVWLETSLWRNGLPVEGPHPVVHVVNGGFEGAAGMFRVRTRESDGSTAEGGWGFVVELGERAVAGAGLAVPGGPAAWSLRGDVQTFHVTAAHPARRMLLEGRSAEGAAWSVFLEVRVEPLSPAFLGDAAAAGEGRDWEPTARGLEAAASLLSRGATGEARP